MIVKVTQEHIDKGRRGEAKFCPIALALKDAGFRSPRVYRWEWYDGAFNTLEFPKQECSRRMEQFIYDFDHGRIPKPFAFRAPKPPVTS